MKSPSEQKIIQIDITNACTHQCSNCTRFCGHHAKPFFMGFDMFKKAVDSMDGYPGMVGVMGGEPTLHPDFERLVSYYASRIPSSKGIGQGRKPMPDFNVHKLENLSDLSVRHSARPR